MKKFLLFLLLCTGVSAQSVVSTTVPVNTSMVVQGRGTNFFSANATNITPRVQTGGLLTGASSLSQLQDLSWYPAAQRQAGQAARLTTGAEYILGSDLITWRIPETADIPTTGNFYAYGDSQTFGSQLDDPGYTTANRYDEPYRWVTLFANGEVSGISRALTVNNYAVSGSRISWQDSGSAFLRQSTLNQIGETLPLNWSGISTLMIGYNNLLYMLAVDTDSDIWIEDGIVATTARLLIDGYASVGKNPNGSAYASWASTGSTTSWARTDATAFDTGTANREATQLDGTETITISTPVGASHVFVFTETNPYLGGAFNVGTNGTTAGTVTNLFYVNSASVLDRYPKAFVIRNPGAGALSLSITNVSGTNNILAIGWVLGATGKQVLVGGQINSPYNVSDTGSGGCLLWNSAVAAGAAQLSDLPVFFADVYGNFLPDSYLNSGDLNHPNRPGQRYVASAFELASKLDTLGRRTIATTRQNTRLSWNSDIKQTQTAGRPSGNATNAGAFFQAISGAISTKGFDMWSEDNLRWRLQSFGAESGTNNSGGAFYLSGYDDSGVRTDYITIFRNTNPTVGGILGGLWNIVNLGPVTIGNTNNAGEVRLNATNGATRAIFYRNGGTNRWSANVTVAGTGVSNDGDNWALQRFSDSGAALGWSIIANRASGDLTFDNVATFASDGSTPSIVTISGPASSTKSLRLGAASTRWQLQSTTDDGYLTTTRFNDSGVSLGIPMQIDRTNGAVRIGENSLTFTGIRYGTNILAGGVVVVYDPTIAENSVIQLTPRGGGAGAGWLTEEQSTRTNGVSFTVRSSNVADTQGVQWIMITP